MVTANGKISKHDLAAGQLMQTDEGGLIVSLRQSE